jgi:hypothetical protein
MSENIKKDSNKKIHIYSDKNGVVHTTDKKYFIKE